MKISIILIICLLILLLVLVRKRETFIGISSIQNPRFVSNDCETLGLPCGEKECCKVTKKTNDDEWTYDYEVTSNCNDEGYINKEVILDKSVCKLKNLGSCRRTNFECVEFMDKDECEKIPGMKWSKHTCEIAPIYEPLY